MRGLTPCKVKALPVAPSTALRTGFDKSQGERMLKHCYKSPFVVSSSNLEEIRKKFGTAEEIRGRNSFEKFGSDHVSCDHSSRSLAAQPFRGQSIDQRQGL